MKNAPAFDDDNEAEPEDDLRAVDELEWELENEPESEDDIAWNPSSYDDDTR